MVYVINPEGKVIYRCDWSFPKKVEKVLQNRDQIHTDDHVQIITAAPWIMIPTVLRGGWDALWDIAVAMPMIILAHLRADWGNFKKNFPNPWIFDTTFSFSVTWERNIKAE